MNTEEDEVSLTQGWLALSSLSVKCRFREILEYFHYHQEFKMRIFPPSIACSFLSVTEGKFG